MMNTKGFCTLHKLPCETDKSTSVSSWERGTKWQASDNWWSTFSCLAVLWLLQVTASVANLKQMQSAETFFLIKVWQRTVWWILKLMSTQVQVYYIIKVCVQDTTVKCLQSASADAMTVTRRYESSYAGSQPSLLSDTVTEGAAWPHSRYGGGHILPCIVCMTIDVSPSLIHRELFKNKMPPPPEMPALWRTQGKGATAGSDWPCWACLCHLSRPHVLVSFTNGFWFFDHYK